MLILRANGIVLYKTWVLLLLVGCTGKVGSSIVSDIEVERQSIWGSKYCAKATSSFLFTKEFFKAFLYLQLGFVIFW